MASLICRADAPARETMIDQIETQYLQARVISSDSPIVSKILEAAAAANPGVSPETWRTVKKEIAAAMTKIYTEKGSIIDTLIRGSLDSFSDRDLAVLNRVLSDPSYKKFVAAMSRPEAQKQMLTGTMESIPKLASSVNSILANHQLKAVN